MTVGRFLGFDRDAAARISFLMSLPVTAGALAYKGAKLVARRWAAPRHRPGVLLGRGDVGGHRAGWPSTTCSSCCAPARSRRSSCTGSIAGAVVLLLIVTGVRPAT